MDIVNKWTDTGWQRICDIMRFSDYDYSEVFEVWLKRNPMVWQGFVHKTNMANMHKHQHRFGAKAILEILRWETVTHDSDATFKINNNWRYTGA